MSSNSGPYIQPYPGELDSYVHQGVWERHDLPPYQRLKWTLSNLIALLVLGCLGALLSLAQSRCWHLLRYIIAQLTKPVQLAGSTTRDQNLELSQGEAVTYFARSLSKWTSQFHQFVKSLLRARPPTVNRDTEYDPVESPWFGVASALNILLFIVMGVAIPWFLTEGAFGAPIVKSRMNESCVQSEMNRHILDMLNRETRADDIFRLCRDSLDSGCDKPYHLRDPQISKTRLTKCPFGGDICINGTAPFEITHWNMSLFEMGVNSRSKLVVNRRLTCAPVSLDPFLWPVGNRSVIYVLKDLPPDGSRVWLNVSLVLETKNGPNKLSNESSGLQASQQGGPVDLTLLPDYSTGIDFFGWGDVELNTFLQRTDGQSFLVIFRAGPWYYSGVVNDPFFSAHNLRPLPYAGLPGEQFSNFYPDYEATALGCFEQFQFCFPPANLSDPCTNWGARKLEFSPMLMYLSAHYPKSYNSDNPIAIIEHWNDQYGWSVKEWMQVIKLVPEKFGVFDYLGSRITIHEILPLIEPSSFLSNNHWLSDWNEQWTIEVEAWFMKAFLSGILAIQDGALYALTDVDPKFSTEYLKEWRLCSRILFHNSNFTNINWIGLWTTIAFLILLCLTCHFVAEIHNALNSIPLMMQALMRLSFLFMRKLSSAIRNTRRHNTWVAQAAAAGDVFELLQMVGRRRPWYDSDDSTGLPGLSATEDVGRSPTDNNSEVNGESSDDYYDIDNPV